MKRTEPIGIAPVPRTNARRNILALLTRVSLLFALLSAGLAPSPISAQTPPACPCTIWSSTATPSVAAANDNNGVELGVKFQSDTSGYITGLRFYKGASNTGTHVGNLWSSTGTLLASATFSGESASGWQQVSFVSAVQITANTTYVASYFAPNGNYSVNGAAFASAGVDNAPLHALSNASGGGNGLYGYAGASAFPNQSYNASNYWVDVVFNTTPPAPVPPAISNVASSGTGASGTTITWITNVATDSQVEYGTTSGYGSSTTLNPTMVTAHSVSLSGLSGSTTYHYRARSKDSGGTLVTSGDFTFTTTAAPVCPCSIWSASVTPGTASANDSGAYELGVKFKPDTSGYVTGIRFYKGPSNSGTHVGNLWSSTGTLLASATFAGETATGWQQVSFASAVQVTANTNYVASYRVPNGGYAVDANFFASSGVDTAPLHALSSPAAGGNGLFSVGAGSAFPTLSYNASNYWVDVVFSTAPPPPPPPTTIGNVASGSITNSGATITWTTNNPASSQVFYGTSAAYGSNTTLDTTLLPSHAQTLSGLNPGTTYHFQVQSRDGTGALVSAPDATFVTAAPPTCPCSIWNSSATPATPSASDTNAVELGVRFKSDLSGYVTGIRFYKGAGNSGTHVGNLWTSSGTRLAGATFTSETASGWQQVSFLSPVQITANTTYVASYFAPNGDYAVTGGAFSSAGVDNAPLHALSSSAGAGNGLYQYGATSQFPTQTYNGGNYWVDLVFTTVTPPPPSGTPTISGTAVSGTSGTTEKVTWQTNVAADSQVEYGATASYGSSTTLDPTLVFAHTVTINGLAAGTPYHYRVKSKDNAGVPAVSADATFTTPNPTVVGQWSQLMNWPLVAVHSSLLDTGKVLTWDAWELGGTPSATLWDPTTNTFTPVPESLAQIFCAAQVQLADGRLLVIGGHNGSEIGINNSTLFDPTNNTWSAGGPMAFARWYPGATLLPDGRAVTLSGQVTDGVWANTPEVYDPASNKWSTINVDTSDVYEGQYPAMYVMPNGKIMNIMPETGRTRILDVDAQTWTQAAPQESASLNGSAIMYQPGKFLLTGGSHNGGLSETVASVLDMNQPNPAWQAVAPMAFGREFHTMVSLPDGTVLVIGGSTNHDITTTIPGPLNAELWNPTTQTFTTLAAEQNPRMYHSTALLLPDATVMVAGGGKLSLATNYQTAEIYSPPYMSKGPRPTITSAPSTFTYGSSIAVQTPDAASIGSVSLVSLGAETHTDNMSQFFVPLTFTAASGSLNVQMPASANLAPPGTYMLFVLNSAGVPSVSKFIKVQLPTPGTPPTISNIASSGVSGVGAHISWNTDRIADSKVDFGTTSAYGSSTALDPVHTENHGAQLINLQSNTTYHYRVRSTDSFGNQTVSGDFTFVTGAPPACPCSIWGPSGTPANANLYDDSGIETGVKFRADADGYINGIRFYKGGVRPGSHKGNLWTTSGTLLASADFTSETASGWQQVTFATPVHITAGTTYVASMYSAGGAYAATASAFATAGVDNPPVHALSSGAASGNGVYIYAATSTFPTESFGGGNYWVDVVYTLNGSLTGSASSPSAGGGSGPTADGNLLGGGGTSATAGGAAMTTELSTAAFGTSTPLGSTVAWASAGNVPLEVAPATFRAAKRLVELGVIRLNGLPHSLGCPIGAQSTSTVGSAQITALPASATATVDDDFAVSTGALGALPLTVPESGSASLDEWLANLDAIHPSLPGSRVATFSSVADRPLSAWIEPVARPRMLFPTALRF